MRELDFLLVNLGEGAMSHGSGGTERACRVLREIQSLNRNCLILGTCGLSTFLKKRQIDLEVKEVDFPRLFHSEKSSFTRFLAYVSCTVSGIQKISDIEPRIVISASDYFPDVFVALCLKIKYPKVKWVSVVHHQNKIHKGNLRKYIFTVMTRFLQLISWFIIRIKSDLLLTYDTREGHDIANSLLLRKMNQKHIMNGLDLEAINLVLPNVHSPDILLAGGPRISKGVFDLPLLLKELSKTFPEVSVGLAGQGTLGTISELMGKLKEGALVHSVHFFGHLEKSELYSLIKGSKVVVSLSYEEGWGIAIREALACGRPCVVYDLPAFQDLSSYVYFVPLGDVNALASKVASILRNPETYIPPRLNQSFKSWKEVAIDDLRLLQELLN